MSIYIGSTEKPKIKLGTTTIAAIMVGAIAVYSASYAFNLTVSADRGEINIYNEAIADGWDGVEALVANVVIDTGVVVLSASTGTPAFMTGNGFPVGSLLSLTNAGTLLGKGGKGGYSHTTAGTSGGGALFVEAAITIDNTNGRIAGGGGGGRGARDSYFVGLPDGTVFAYAGGGGGVGEGDSGGNGGNVGTKLAGGTTFAVTYLAAVAEGGNGGGYGAAGGNSQQGNAESSRGSGGYAVSGDSNITWTAEGTRNGTVS